MPVASSPLPAAIRVCSPVPQPTSSTRPRECARLGQSREGGLRVADVPWRCPLLIGGVEGLMSPPCWRSMPPTGCLGHLQELWVAVEVLLGFSGVVGHVAFYNTTWRHTAQSSGQEVGGAPEPGICGFTWSRFRAQFEPQSSAARRNGHDNSLKVVIMATRGERGTTLGRESSTPGLDILLSFVVHRVDARHFTLFARTAPLECGQQYAPEWRPRDWRAPEHRVRSGLWGQPGQPGRGRHCSLSQRGPKASARG